MCIAVICDPESYGWWLSHNGISGERYVLVTGEDSVRDERFDKIVLCGNYLQMDNWHWLQGLAEGKMK